MKINSSSSMYQKTSLFLLCWCISFITSHSQVMSDSLLVEGHYRNFYFHQPSTPLQKGSLVFVLHGSGGNGLSMKKQTTLLEETASHDNVIFVYPTGYKNYWNECRKAASSLANKEDINEQAFFSAMIDYFSSHYGTDNHKVFAVGTSGGGHMAYKLAITMPGKFKAITAIIANLPDAANMDCQESKKALPVMIINGTADPLNPYNGGLMQSGTFIMGTVRSTDNTFHYWSGLAGYKGEPVKDLLPDTDPTDERTIEQYRFKDKGKPEIVLLKVVGGKHDYPRDIDVHVTAWEFFKRQL